MVMIVLNINVISLLRTSYCLYLSLEYEFYLYTYYSYFKAMSKGETPPVKERLEMPVATQKTDTGLTPGLLRVLNKQVYETICI